MSSNSMLCNTNRKWTTIYLTFNVALIYCHARCQRHHSSASFESVVEKRERSEFWEVMRAERYARVAPSDYDEIRREATRLGLVR